MKSLSILLALETFSNLINTGPIRIQLLDQCVSAQEILSTMVTNGIMPELSINIILGSREGVTHEKNVQDVQKAAVICCQKTIRAN